MNNIMPKGFMPMRFGREPLAEEQAYQQLAKTKGVPAAKVKESFHKMETTREDKMWEVDDLETIEVEVHGKKVKKSKRQIVDSYIGLVKSIKALRQAVRWAGTEKEREKWTKNLKAKVRMYNLMLSDPKESLQLEKAYREWLHGKQLYLRFLHLEREWKAINAAIEDPVFEGKLKKVTTGELVRLQAISSAEIKEAEEWSADDDELLSLLMDKKPEIAVEEAMPKKKDEKKLTGWEELDLTGKSLVELKQLRLAREQDLTRLWNLSDVRYFEQVYQLDKMLKDVQARKEVLETPTTIGYLNQLAEWERLHQDTTIGGVLVGEPGVGKTTVVRHYLEMRGRGYKYIDLSEDVTRYLLFGTKALEFKSPTEYYRELARKIGEMDEKQLAKFIKENGRRVSKTFKGLGLSEGQGEVVAFNLLEERLAEAAQFKPNSEHLEAARKMMSEQAERVYRRELADEFRHLVEKNGWRDGIVVAALRSGESVIFDEFVKMKDWSLLFGLLTAKPGTKWKFADNVEEIEIPRHWRMYFTANIGRKHAGYKVGEALASRAQGKVMEIGEPPLKEEITVGLATLCDVEGNFLRDRDDILKMLILVKEVFPKIRSLIRGKENVLPVSWRTIWDISNKLVETVELGQGKKIRRAYEGKTFDEALYEVLTQSYALWEDKKLAKEVVKQCAAARLLLSPEMKERIVERDKYMTEEEWETAIKAAEEGKKDIEELMEEVHRSRTRGFESSARPTRLAF